MQGKIVGVAAVSALIFCWIDVSEAVDVELSEATIEMSFDGQHALTAHVRSIYNLHNADGKVFQGRVELPLTMRRQAHRFARAKPTFQLTVKEQPATYDLQRIEYPEVSDSQRAAFWPVLREWISEDPELQELVDECLELEPLVSSTSEHTKQFKDLIAPHLINPDNAQTALYVATDNSWPGYLLRLMPEIDASLRIETPGKAQSYVSVIDEQSHRVYQKHAAEWTERAQRWLQSKKELEEVLPAVRRAYESIARRDTLWKQIQKHVHDQRGLSLESSLVFHRFMHGKGRPSESLIREIAPDVFAQTQHQREETRQRIEMLGLHYGDLSPITGAFTKRSTRFGASWQPWRDRSVYELLSYAPPWPNPETKPPATALLFQVACRLQPNESAKLSVEYRTRVSAFADNPGNGLFIPAADSLNIAIPGKDPAKISVTLPEGFRAVFNLSPTDTRLHQNGRCTYTIAVNTPNAKQSELPSMLHFIPVSVRNEPYGWLARFRQTDHRCEPDLQELIAKTENTSAKPLLMLGLYWIQSQSGRPWKAEQTADRLAERFPSMLPVVDSIRSKEYHSRRGHDFAEWIESKAQSPILKSDADFKRFGPHDSGEVVLLARDALAHLAGRVNQLDPNELTPPEQLGRLYILIQAGIDEENNLRGLERLAMTDHKSLVIALRLISKLYVPQKHRLLPFVLSQVDIDLMDKVRKGLEKVDSPAWVVRNRSYEALRSFRSAEAGKPLIEFISKCSDGLLNQGAVNSLSRMTLPGEFDDLLSISNRVAASSESAMIQYLNLVVRSAPNEKRAEEFLLEISQQKQRYSHCVLRCLGQLKSSDGLATALDCYQNCDVGDPELQAAIGVLGDLATPKDLVKLTYRKGLPKWMNENLISIIRRSGGPGELLEFLDAYYHEHLVGKPIPRGEVLPRAYRTLGDARAIPVLREMLPFADDTAAIAKVIGELEYGSGISSPDSAASSIHSALNQILVSRRMTPDQGEDWQSLLKDPKLTLQRMMIASPLVDVISGGTDIADPIQRERLTFLKAFGEDAVSSLLDASEGCSLIERYRIAELLQFLLPEHSQRLKMENRFNVTDPLRADRLKTAALAMQIFSNRQTKGGVK